MSLSTWGIVFLLLVMKDIEKYFDDVRNVFSFFFFLLSLSFFLFQIFQQEREKRALRQLLYATRSSCNSNQSQIHPSTLLLDNDINS